MLVNFIGQIAAILIADFEQHLFLCACARLHRHNSNFDRKVFAYVAFHIISGSVVVARSNRGDINGVGFVWPDVEREVIRRAQNDLPQFNWTQPTKEGDCYFIAEVIGNRKSCAAMYQWFSAKTKDFVASPKYTYRRGKLKVLNYGRLKQFCDTRKGAKA